MSYWIECTAPSNIRSIPSPSILRESCLSALGRLAASRFGALQPYLIVFPEAKEGAGEGEGEGSAAEAPSLVPSLPFLNPRVSRLSLLRRMCQVAGLRIVSRDLDFSVPCPFTLDDIVSLVPLVSHSMSTLNLSCLPCCSCIPDIKSHSCCPCSYRLDLHSY